MNTRLFIALLAVLIVLSAAIMPAIAAGSGEDRETSAVAPVTASLSEPRLWSGAIVASDNNNPDRALKIETSAVPQAQSGCRSEESQPRRHGGCLE